MLFKRILVMAVMLLVYAPFALAQNEERKVEIFVGVSMLGAQNALANKDIKTFDGITPAQFKALTGFKLLDDDQYVPAYGFEGNVTRYFSRHVGISGDFSGYYQNGRNFRVGDSLFKADHTIYHLLGGPQVKFLNDRRVNVFLHGLAGVAHTSVAYKGVPASGSVTANDSSTRFAIALGAGIDVRINKRFSVRVFQMDWIPMLGKDRRVTASDGTVIDIMGRAQQGNARMSAGIVF